ncbi:hypothetical protein HHI36_004144 [Cryptolaemus montrouzieri]|uniref:Gustatory receptor n=1 Tax=Cryptolaemus montrouzieri TaxID=559131 RepID=A0ABD2NR41_9CUCU
MRLDKEYPLLEAVQRTVTVWIYKFIDRPTDVYSGISPLIRFNFFLGLAPYRLKKSLTNNLMIYHSKWANLCSFVVVLLNIAVILVNMEVGYSEKADQDFKQKLRYYQEVGAGVLTLLGVFCNFVYSKKMMQIFPNIQGIDESMKVLFIWVDHSIVQVNIIISLFLNVVYMLLISCWIAMEYLEYVPSVLLSNHHAFVVANLLIPYCIVIIMETQYYHYLSLVHSRYKLLNDYLMTLLPTENRHKGWTEETITKLPEPMKNKEELAKKILSACDPVFIVDHIAALHIRLTDTAYLINKAFAIQLLIKVAITFVSIVSALYFIAIHFSKANHGDLDILFVVWATSNALEVLVTVHVTSQTCDEANNCPRILHKIRNHSNNEDLQEIIEIYSLQMYHNRLIFTAIGLFPLDYTLLYSMVAGMTTYLVILIQFNPQDFSMNMNFTTRNITM